MSLIAVVGATGSQGGAVVDALLRKGFSVRGFTRYADSEKAEALRRKGVEVVAADKDVEAYVREREAPHKRLRGGVRFQDVIPKSAAGKILRRVQVEMDRKNDSEGKF